ncbi:hypothetical protein [Paracoccus sediminilitoris]|uniref:hypothetical protein n=1 Tax=Paracoccus sediminilitoris TaxID=2202419 RepID=UPI00272A1614|nr:hypothetical protein [Paracoccus sediminilitoris]
MIEEFNMVVLRHVIALITPLDPGFVPKGPLQRQGQPTPNHAPITAMCLKNRGFSGVKNGNGRNLPIAPPENPPAWQPSAAILDRRFSGGQFPSITPSSLSSAAKP